MSCKIEKLPGGVRFRFEEKFDLARTLESGQCFRWERREDGFFGVAGGYAAFLRQISPTCIELQSSDPCPDRWIDYLDLERSYRAVDILLCEDPILARAVEAAEGLHILRQEPWEALASFILSQNNNIPRIRGIIARLCETFGTPLGEGCFAFPDAQALAPLSVEDLAPLRAGFRAKYLLDAARRVTDGRLDLASLHQAETAELRDRLMEIYGVGRKVADCTLLYGFGRIEVCPVDVWMKRALTQYEDGELPEAARPYAGIAQQYLFEYTRNHQ